MTTADKIANALREIAPGKRLFGEDIAPINSIAANWDARPQLKSTTPLAWGAKVSPEFRARARGVAANIFVDPSDFMTCMAWESGRTFSPSVKNMAGSGATGLIQFMPSTALSLGTTVDLLAHMTAVQQLDWVEKYFFPFRGKLHDLADLYMAILWPPAIGKPMEYVLWDKASRPTTYRQNSGLDLDKDGAITKAECSAKLFAMKAEGLKPENIA
jgi:hypothetical protein